MKMVKLLAMSFVLFFIVSPNVWAIKITKIKMAHDVSNQYEPIRPTSKFSTKDKQIFCWFSWKDAEINQNIVAKWYYVTEDTAVLEHSFAIPRKNAAGSVALQVPDDVTLPEGKYRITLEVDGKPLKKDTFKIFKPKS